jgi:predicted Zn-ribbon and HTH transcriptional regulator
MKCEKCSYDWTPRKETPKECPRCKTRLDYKEIQLVAGGAR